MTRVIAIAATLLLTYVAIIMASQLRAEELSLTDDALAPERIAS